MEPKQELVAVLCEIRALLARPDNDFGWSSWNDASEALSEIDRLIAAIERGDMPMRLDISILFAPTGAIQDVSLSSGWSQEFLKIAAQYDAIEKRMWVHDERGA